jgi:circadian clock protein KaiC
VARAEHAGLEKSPSGIAGLDRITGGGLPTGRPTLVCGSAGCGKTLFAAQFLVRGALDQGEAGVFMSFEETGAEIAQNVRSLGWDLETLERDKLLIVDHVRIDAAEIQETGSYDLEGLFIRLGSAIDEIGAKRVVLDTLEVLFASLKDQVAVRSELRRLFRWLKERGVTAVITAERGDGMMTRHGLEEYVSDCVILLDHRISDQLSTRRLRVVKYRGSAHSSDECPFLIDEDGFRALPMTSLALEHGASTERVSTGVPRLDAMLGGHGYHRGSSVLISGTPGSGKTPLATTFAAAGCERGERVLYLAFEESPQQILRNVRSVGVDLQPHLDSGLLTIRATRPSSSGLESHLSTILAQVESIGPDLVVVDPLSAFGAMGQREAMFARLIDALKSQGITALCTSLVGKDGDVYGLGISSVIDTWLSLSTVESNGERNRGLTIIKARGTQHSNQVREFVMRSDGVHLLDVYTGPQGVLMGTGRQIRQAQDEASRQLAADRTEEARRALQRRKEAVEAQILSLRAELEQDIAALELSLRSEELQAQAAQADARALALARGADEPDE